MYFVLEDMSPMEYSMTGLKERKEQAQFYLTTSQVEEAENIYVGILRENPQDAEAYFDLGRCYLVAGDFETAILLFTQALKYDPANLEYLEQRSLAINLMIQAATERARKIETTAGQAEQGSIPTEPQAVLSLLQNVSGGIQPVTEEQVNRAAEMLERVINSSHPAQTVAEHLDEIDALLPALLELNIRQARSDGRPELAEALQALLNNIYLQIGNRELEASLTPAEPVAAVPERATRILFLGPANLPMSLRQLLPAEVLSGRTCEVTVATQFPPDFQQRFDIVIAHHPHADPALLPGLAACSGAHIPIILDLDTDFEQIPVSHPDYPLLSLGTPVVAKAYTAALLLADQVCVSNENLALPLREAGHRVQVIPDGWSKANDLWEKPPSSRRTLNLGWIGQQGQIEDIAQIRRYITRLMREFTHINLVIVGDPLVYQLFESLPEARRLFLPPVNLEDYPYLLGQIDILLAPFRNIPFNQSISDRQLMEAGVRRIPWVASPLPSFLAWGIGGLIANTPDEWHTHLRQLVMDPTLRISLGQEGRLKAEEREMGRLAGLWHDLICSSLPKKFDL